MTREDINDIINAICPNDEDYEKPCISPKYLKQELEQLALDQRQRNEDPTTKNDSPKYCDRNICLKNEYNNIGCEDCEVTKSQEPTTNSETLVSLDVYSQVVKERNIAILQLHELGYEFGQKIEPTKNNLAHNLCNSCTNIGCEFQSGIVRTECAFYMPPQLEPDNCGNYVVQDTTTKNASGVDCISRADAQTKIEMNASRYTIAKERGGMGQVEWSDQLIKVSDAVDIIRHLPPVTLQEQRKGHWIKLYYWRDSYKIQCSECTQVFAMGDEIPRNYCPFCGARMMESEDEDETNN